MVAPRRLTAAVALAFVLLLSACSSSGSNQLDAAPSIEEVLTRSSEAMAEIETVRFVIEQTGAEVFIDQGMIIRFLGATGRYAAPSSADAVVQVDALGLNTEVGAVAIEGQIWITNPLTGAWETAPPDFAFDPTVLFSPTVGWSALLAGGLTDARLISPDPVAEARQQVRGTIAAATVSTLTGGLVDQESVIDIWIDGPSGQVVEAAFDVGEGVELTSWLMVLSDYGAEVTIAEPELGS